MLFLNLKPILAARGIERPYSFLVKAGFTPPTAHNLLHSNTSTFRLKHIEKLCLILNCTPSDLLLWKKNSNEIVDANHSLTALKTAAIIPTNWLQTFKTISLQDLKLLTDIVNNYKK